MFPEQFGCSHTLQRLPQAILGPLRNKRLLQPPGCVYKQNAEAVKCVSYPLRDHTDRYGSLQTPTWAPFQAFPTRVSRDLWPAGKQSQTWEDWVLVDPVLTTILEAC